MTALAGWSGLGLLAAAVLVAMLKIYIAGERTLTQTELALFDIVTLLLTSLGAIKIGGQVEQGQAQRLIGPHGRSAFRRATSLYVALKRFERQIERQREALPARSVGGRIDLDVVELAFEVFAAQVGEQVMAASHAMEDWRDVVPTEVEQLEQEARARQRLEEQKTTS